MRLITYFTTIFIVDELIKQCTREKQTDRWTNPFVEFKETSPPKKEKIEYKFSYKKLSADRWNEEKRMSSMVYVTCSQPKSKQVIARLTNRQTNEVTSSHLTEKKREKRKPE